MNKHLTSAQRMYTNEHRYMEMFLTSDELQMFELKLC